MVATIQSQCWNALKDTLFYHLFYSEQDHNLQNERHTLFKKTRI